MGIQPVGREHHEDEVGVELLLLFFHTVHVVVVCFHTCGRRQVSLEDAMQKAASNTEDLSRTAKTSALPRADFRGTAASL